MEKQVVFVSNRLAVSVDHEPNGELSFTPSVGGLATGLSSVSTGSRPPLWIGWSGLPADELTEDEQRTIAQRLRRDHNAVAVDISQDELDLFYSGYCNDTIWPLFHYFPTYTEYEPQTWEAYQRINQRFFDVIAEEIEEDAIIWVHDYQLMLLPGMIRQRFPHAEVGFFLHIPFPSYEMFRLLPNREEVIEGLLGADLIGFHTYDYARHFLSSVRRLVGYDHSMGIIRAGDRTVKVDVFPMGIDWERFSQADSLPEVQKVVAQMERTHQDRKVILSVDRLDYSKGIPSRIQAFRRLLELHPEIVQKVHLLLIVSPSRESVPRYMELKHEVDSLVSDINGRWSTLDWVPIHYQYQTASFAELGGIYRRSDVMLVNPLRDGMNLVAKEYIAARNDERGALVLSETAGAARELSEAIQVNPSDLNGIAEAMYHAITLTEAEQHELMRPMRARVKRFTVQYWAADFLEKLRGMHEIHENNRALPLSAQRRDELIARFAAGTRCLLFLDYDGTLMRFHRQPDHARPDEAVRQLLRDLHRLPGVSVVISSGRDRSNLEEWFHDEPFLIGAGHGAWIREENGDWHAASVQNPDWKDYIRPIIQRMVDRTPGSMMEEKNFSLAWHYRNSEPELANVRLAELRETIISLTANLEISVLDGNRVLEVKPVHIHKGRVVHHFVELTQPDVVIAIGDDATDEYMFHALPEEGVALKVGVGTTAASYSIPGVPDVRRLLQDMREARHGSAAN